MTTENKHKEYKTPKSMVDVVIFTIDEGKLKVLLIKRGADPYKGAWALPGGAVRVDPKEPVFDESLEAAAKRELLEETGVEASYLEQLMTVGDSKRDPSGWVLSTVYFALIPIEKIRLQHGTDAADARLFTVNGNSVNKTLAYDHNEILRNAIKRLRSKVEYTSIAVHLLPDEFTLSELQKTYEILLGEPLAKAAFRRSLAKAGIVEEVKGKMKEFTHGGRPAQLYKFTPQQDVDIFFPRSITRTSSSAP